MPEAIFLSASIPDPRRAPAYAVTSDSVAIASAVSALVNVTLGRRLLVWGGHPAITPMIWIVAEDVSVDYGSWVRLYQSKYFEEQFPEDNERFSNVTYTDTIDGDRERSLRVMRERMISDYVFNSGVFIGGMDGILQEFKIFRNLQPKAQLLPIGSTGGAALEVARQLPELHPDLLDDFDYISMFHRLLGIPTNEKRFSRPEEQPVQIEHRLWQLPDNGS